MAEAVQPQESAAPPEDTRPVAQFRFDWRWTDIFWILGVALLWLMKILLITSVASTEFASKVAQLFPVKDQWLLILVSILLGGLVGGFAALTGGLARGKPQKTKYRGELGF